MRVILLFVLCAETRSTKYINHSGKGLPFSGIGITKKGTAA